jgi:hypothetical protein
MVRGDGVVHPRLGLGSDDGRLSAIDVVAVSSVQLLLFLHLSMQLFHLGGHTD